MRNECLRILMFWTVAGFLVSDSFAAEPVDYARDVKPIFQARCFACHGVLKQESGLRLDTGQLIRQGGDSGPAVAPEKFDDSLLLRRVSATDASERMPPEGEPLKPEQIELIRQWISQGATSPADEKPEPGPGDHWSFQPVARPTTPVASHPEWLANPIDAFIAEEHIRRGLETQSSAPREVLLRRVYLDLIGLPPTREELQSFLADTSPDAFERVVDRLLASPQYGERWARHWMDVWRYADWHGRRMVPDVWNSAPQIWRWRDWIVRSLNDDKGYDRMLSEMLAADEIDPENDEAGHATGYLIRNWYALNPNDWMRSTVEHTGKAFLGLTFNCAHCHDHKYDPITQEDYFRLRAFFEPIGIRQDRLPGEADPGPFQEYSYSVLRKIVRLGSVRIYDKNPAATTWFYTGGDERNRVSERGGIAPGVPGFITQSPLNIEPVKLPPRAWYPGLRPAIQETIRAERLAAIAEAQSELSAARAAADTALPALREQLAKAEAELENAAREAERTGRLSALAGRQSLLFDATSGRRILQNRLQQVKSLDDGSAISFQLRILNDAHFNFQLAKDVVKGLTAGYVAFEKGRIVSYQPGSFTEFEVGRYDFSAGQTRFDVTLVLRTQEDRCLLTVRCGAGDKVQTLVDNTPVALNGWNPVGDPVKGFSFDARAGSIAAIDEVSLNGPAPVAAASQAAPPRLAYFDFESPSCTDGRDVAGIDGWEVSTFGQGPAISVVSIAVGDSALSNISQSTHHARRAAQSQELNVKSFESKLAARAAELASVEARIAADNGKYGENPRGNLELLSRAASEAERAAAIRLAEWDVLAKEQLLAAAEAKPATDAKRVPEIDAATKQLEAARQALAKSRTAPTDAAAAVTYTSFSPTYPDTSTGRRRALARWMTDRKNPLTARVAVNHIWMRHFHSPLVATVYDLGRNGQPPTHPRLLEWLAAELMDSGWNMKHLHRLIVTSHAYRMRSSVQIAGEISSSHALDPENKFLWRMNVGRMESEVVRDALLYGADRLDLRMSGQELENSQALTTYRRTLYYSCHPELDGKSELGALFDAPEPLECYRRTQSVIPQQALALTNSELVHDLSGSLAAALWQSLSPQQQSQPQSFIIAAYEQILCRAPTDAELQVCTTFLSSAGDAVRLRESLVRAVINHNDFIAIR